MYEQLGYICKFIFIKKIYKKNSPKTNNDITAIIPYKSIEKDIVINRDDSYFAVVEINPIDFTMLSEEKQNEYIDGVFGRVLNNINLADEYFIVKMERPLILDNNINDELERLNNLIKLREKGCLSYEEQLPRVDLIQDRISLIDQINSEDTTFYSRYYLCLVSDNKSHLNENIEKISGIFNLGGISASRLKGKELSLFLRYLIDSNYDDRLIDEKTNCEDLIIPEEVRFSLTNFKQNNKVVSQFVINNFPLKVDNAWGRALFNMENTKVVMRLKPVDKYKAIKRIDNTILELQTNESKNKVSDIIDKQTHLETLEDLLINIKNSNETLFDTTIIITVYDEINSTKNKKKVKEKLRELGFGFNDMVGRQSETYISSSISLKNLIDLSRGIPTSTISACFPFVSNKIMDNKGLLIGENELPVFVNFFKRDEQHINSNMVVIGNPGSGKSYATKTILTGLASSGTKIYVLDPENEYGNLARKLKGSNIDLASSSCGRINPFQIIKGIDDEKNSYYAHLQFLEQFYKLILVGINADSLEMLNQVTQELYELKGINYKTNLSELTNCSYPTFEELYILINEKLVKESDEYARSCLKVLLNYISKFKSGGRNSNLWNGYTTFSPSENFISFNFQRLLSNKNDVTANAQMLLVLKWLENEVINNREYNNKNKTNRKFIIAIDEAHLFIDEKYPVALDFMYQLAKRIRKYDGMLIIITQNIKDFAGTNETLRKTSAIINVSQYSLIFSLSPNDITELCKLYENAGRINDLEKENIVHNPRGRAFFISSPSKRTNIEIIATNLTEEVFS